jgi:hypothetical protein
MLARMPVWLVTIAIVAASSSCDRRRGHAFHWDGRRVVCSEAIDDRDHGLRWDRIEREIRAAAATSSALAFHAHVPGVTVSRETIARVLDLAARYGLVAMTFRELATTAHRVGAIALAFDDASPAAWLSVAELLASRHAHVTFFIAGWDAMSDAARADLRRLADAGHDIEPHGAHHVRAPEYVRAHGVVAYVRDEVLPSIDALRAAGYPPPTTFAYPGGFHTAELDGVLLAQFDLVRTTLSQCP